MTPIERKHLKRLHGLAVNEALSNPENAEIRFTIDWLNDQLEDFLEVPPKQNQQPSKNLLQIKALRVLLEAQNQALPIACLNSSVHRQISLRVQQLDSEIETLETSGEFTSLNHLQQQAIAQYGEFGLLIEALRDAANGALPHCFTKIGNLLARYRDSEIKDLEGWIWTLESMKSALNSEIENCKSELYDRRGV